MKTYKNINTIVAFCLIVITILACSCGKMYKKSARSKSSITKIGQYTDGQGTFLWANYDATRRGGLMYVSNEGTVRVLAENSPDAAIESINKLSTKVKVKDVVNVDATLETQRAIAELGKRTVAVNVLRDALYRINEMYYSSEDKRYAMIKNCIIPLDNNITTTVTTTTGVGTTTSSITYTITSQTNTGQNLTITSINNSKKPNWMGCNKERTYQKSEIKNYHTNDIGCIERISTLTGFFQPIEIKEMYLHVLSTTSLITKYESEVEMQKSINIAKKNEALIAALNKLDKKISLDSLKIIIQNLK